MNRASITAHAMYDQDDYAYLQAKGWTDAQILDRWNAEAKAGKVPCTWNHPTARAKLLSTP